MVPQVPAGQVFGQARLCEFDPVVVPQDPAGQRFGQALSCEVLPVVVPQVPAGHTSPQEVSPLLVHSNHVPASQAIHNEAAFP